MADDQTIFELGGLLAAGYGIYQAKAIHDKELEKSQQRHKEAVELAKTQHELDMKTTKQTYLLHIFNSLEQHFQQLNADLIMNSRESERDMFDQRNQSFQVIILSASIMFAALSSIIVAGDIPENSGRFLLVAYALTSALSFSFLFLSIVFCFELVSRTSLFMYKRGKLHNRSLKKAINDTKMMMRDLRGEGRHTPASDEATNPSSASLGTTVGGLFRNEDDAARRAKQNFMKHSVTSIASLNDIGDVKAMRRAISHMEPHQIEEEFDRHEQQIRGYMKRRELLNYSSTINTNRNVVTGHKRSFKHFWEESCELWWNLAILFFYAGSLNMIFVLMVYMWAAFILFYDNLYSATIGVVVLGLICVIGLVIVLVMSHVDKQAKRRYVLDTHATISHVPIGDSKRQPENTNKGELSAVERLEAGASGFASVFSRGRRSFSSSSNLHRDHTDTESGRRVHEAHGAAGRAHGAQSKHFRASSASARGGAWEHPPRAQQALRRTSLESTNSLDAAAETPRGLSPQRTARRGMASRSGKNNPRKENISFLSALGQQQHDSPLHSPATRPATLFQSIHRRAPTAPAAPDGGPSHSSPPPGPST